MRKNSTLSVTAGAKVTPELKRDAQAMAAKFQLDISDIVRHGVYRYVRYLQSLDGGPEERERERRTVNLAILEMCEGPTTWALWEDEDHSLFKENAKA